MRSLPIGLLSLLLVAAPAFAQATLVADINPGSPSSTPSELTPLGNTLYFAATSDGSDYALWRYVPATGTAELAADVNPEESGLPPTDLTVHDGRLYFTVQELLDEGVFARIWSFDAETDTAEPISDLLWPFTQIFVYDGRLFFTSADSTGYALWAYDANADTTTLAASGSVFESGIGDPTVYDGRLFFRARPDQLSSAYDLWFYDAATGEVAQTDVINPEGNSYPSSLAVYDDRLFFSASNDEVIEELWQYNAATGAASLAADISPVMNPNGSSPRNLTVYHDRLFFYVLGDNFNRELWSYDAATEEASFIADVSPTMGELGDMAVFDDRLFFPTSGGSLGVYDAATGETSLLDLDVSDLTVFDGRLFFSGFDIEHGVELWAYSAPAVSVDPGASPDAVTLSPAFPNPTRGTATLSLTLTEPQRVRVSAHDLLGREIVVLHDGPLSVGTAHLLMLDATGLPVGIYFVRAVGETFSETRRVTVVR